MTFRKKKKNTPLHSLCRLPPGPSFFFEKKRSKKNCTLHSHTLKILKIIYSWNFPFSCWEFWLCSNSAGCYKVTFDLFFFVW